MAARSVVTSASHRNLKRLASRQAAVAALAGVVLLLTSAVALALTGDLTEPAGTAGCVSEDGSGPLRGRPGPLRVHRRCRSPAEGTSTSLRSTATPWRVSTATRPAGPSHSPPGTAGCVSETGSGPCADGHGLAHPTGVAVSPDGQERLRRLLLRRAVARFNRNTTTGAITQPAGTAGCVSEDGAGPCADGHALDGATGSRSARTARASTSPRLSATPWRASPATRPAARSPSPPGPPGAWARWEGPARRPGSTARMGWR